MSIKITSLLTLLALTAGLQQAWGIRASREVQTWTQPDGTRVEYVVSGDERANVFTTLDGHPLVWDGDTLCYGTLDAQGAYVSSGQPAGTVTPQNVQLQGTPADMSTLRDAALQASANANQWKGKFPSCKYPTLGKPKVLFVLIQYKDVKFKTNYTCGTVKDYYEGLLKQDNYNLYGATGSAHQYFYENSQGKFDPDIVILGPVTLKYNSSYYAANEDYNCDEMIIEACQQLDSIVDFKDFDCDNNGIIDNVYGLYAGRGRNDGGGSSAVWPLSSEVYGLHYHDGVKLSSFAISNELDRYGNPTGIGTFVHEFSHVMGLPDLYYTGTGSGTYPTPDEWSVMDYGPYLNNGHTPPLYSSFERSALGWLDPVVLDKDMDVTIPQLSNGTAYAILTDDANEYFLLENRQKSGWDAYLPSHGMLVWHIDYDANVWENNAPNNVKDHQRVDLVEAAANATGRAKDSDPFPGSSMVTSRTLKDWDGNTAGKPITRIAETNRLITFKYGEGSSSVSDLSFDAAANAVIARYDLQGRAVDASYRGIVIERHADGTATRSISR